MGTFRSISDRIIHTKRFSTRHLTLATYRDTAVAYSPTSLRFTREQSVGDPISYDFVVTILISWCPKIEVVPGSPAP